jgi:secernin
MCDTLCAITERGAIFGKNSDRPSAEIQLIEAYPRREAGGRLRTQYLEVEDTGAFALVGSRPDWLWGFEHGVNEHRVAIGNEKVWTRDDPFAAKPALIGMDLVRLGLERGRTADDALEQMTALLEGHGQGGIADQHGNEPYFSSFLIADSQAGWILETSGRTWVAAPVQGSAAISNRLTIRKEWTRSSSDVPPGADWDEWRSPRAPTGHADRRLAASRACLSAGSPYELTPADFAAHLRSHEDGPWGAPGSAGDKVSPLPASFDPKSGEGVTVCMHLRGYQNTTSSMIAELPEDPDVPLRAWVALGNPCMSIYVPVFPPRAVPGELADPGVWSRFAALRDWAEQEPDALAEIHGVFGPLEAELWAESDAVAHDLAGQESHVNGAWKRVEAALASLERATASAAQ